jgi:hypothetical protein
VKRDDDTDHIERFLAKHRLPYRFERRAKHRAVIIRQGGRDVTVFFPLTGDRYFGPHIVVRKLRHALGLVGKAVAR